MARARKSTAGCLDGLAWTEIKALPIPWFSGLAILLELVESSGIWPQGLLDAKIAMIPKADGDSTPPGQRPLSVLPVLYRLWASLRLGHLREWVEGWLPKSVLSLGNGLSSLEAWFSTALDIEEVLSGTGGDQLRVMVADVIKSFALWISPFWIALWVDWVYLIGFVGLIFLFIVRFVLGLSLLLVLESLGVGTVVYPRVVRLVWFSLWPYMSRGVVILSLCLMSNRSFTPMILSVVRSVQVLFWGLLISLLNMSGQLVRMCLLVNVSARDISGGGSFWKVQLDVRDLGGHLDFTGRARAGTLSKRVGEAILGGGASIGALPLGIQVKLGLVRGKYLRAGLHAAKLLMSPPRQ